MNYSCLLTSSFINIRFVVKMYIPSTSSEQAKKDLRGAMDVSTYCWTYDAASAPHSSVVLEMTHFKVSLDLLQNAFMLI